jgi:transcriptional regulator with XRE-family HTH domain
VSEEVTHGTSDKWDDIPVGRALASLRKRAGLTGQDLARRVQMSQSKISRIETGTAPVDPKDVGRLAEALGAPDETVRRLVARSRPAAKQQVSWRLSPDDIPHRQREIAEIEAATRVTREYSPMVIVGLLQTGEYARGVLAAVHSFLSVDELNPRAETVILSAAARIARQQVLANPNKEFRFVMPESALWNRFCEPDDMLAQLRRLREVAAQDNVWLGLIPVDTRWPFPATQDFAIFDESCVLLDMPNSNIMSRGAEDVAVYRRLFDLLETQATTDIDGILERHATRYYELARPRYT